MVNGEDGPGLFYFSLRYIKNMDIGGISGGAGPRRMGPGPLVIGKGDVLKALVVEVISENKAVLEIAGRTITARTAFSLAGMKGKTALLKSLGSGQAGELLLKLEGEAGEAAGTSTQTEDLAGQLQTSLEKGGPTGTLSGKLENLLLEAFTAGGTFTAGEKSALGGLLVRILDYGGPGFSQKLPALISMADALANDAGPDEEGLSGKLLAAISGLFPGVEELTAESLKKALMAGGGLLESKLLANSKAGADGFFSFNKRPANEGANDFPLAGHDLKALLLKLKAAFGDEGQAGQRGLFKTVDGLLRDIRSFQFLSKLTGSLYCFLPVKWEGLKDGRIAFKPDGRGGGPDGQGGSCLINLDLDGLGKIAVSVFMRGGEFYITLKIQNPSFREAVNGEARDALKEAFREKDLSLRTVNVTDYEDSPKNHLEFPGGDHLINIRL